MKVIAVILILGFLLLTGIPLAGSEQSGEKRGCCTEGAGGRMTCNMNNQMHSCTCTTQAIPSRATAHQGCTGTCSTLTAIPAQTSGVFTRIRRYSVEGYRRISGKNILDHQARSLMYESIVQTPGVDLKTLARLTGINENTARYHLEQMQKTGKIITAVIGGSSHFFENHGKYSEDEQVLRARMFSSSSRILRMIEARPGISRGEVADILGISGPSVTRNMGYLIHDGLVRSSREGRFTRYYPGWSENTGPETPLRG
jgi:DNA-binding CsgD family transcriptional regulator